MYPGKSSTRSGIHASLIIQTISVIDTVESEKIYRMLSCIRCTFSFFFSINPTINYNEEKDVSQHGNTRMQEAVQKCYCVINQKISMFRIPCFWGINQNKSWQSGSYWSCQHGRKIRDGELTWSFLWCRASEIAGCRSPCSGRAFGAEEEEESGCRDGIAGI